MLVEGSKKELKVAPGFNFARSGAVNTPFRRELLSTIGKKTQEIGKELYADGGVDVMKNSFYPIEFRVKEETGKQAKPYRSWCKI